MVRMFCTVREAAEQLKANPEQVETLLQRGILHEFRDGPHRLLRAAEVGALTAARGDDRRSESPTPKHNATGPLPPRHDRRSAGSAASEIRLPRAATVVVRHSGGVVRPRNAERFQRQEPSRGRPSRHRPTSNRVPRSSPQSHMEVQDLSVRQWLWNGLTQDRPAAIALLSGFVLLALSALIGGLFMLSEIF